jgi:hypothetical protein
MEDIKMVKKKIVFGAAACAGLLLSALPAASREGTSFDLRTTHEFYTLCSAKPDAPEYDSSIAACLGFISGVVQYHDGVNDGKRLPRWICYPEGTTREDGREAFINWAEANRDNKALMDQMPVRGLVKALAEKYPCPETTDKK